jgi:hypothetical protein
MLCVADKQGTQCTVCGLPLVSPKSFRKCVVRNSSGCLAGTHLKQLLAAWPFRIVATADCKCTSRANYMDAKGCDWCESPDGMAEIIGFLRESAEERGLPFVDMAGRMLVRRAIANARKAEARRAKEAEAAAAEGPAA